MQCAAGTTLEDAFAPYAGMVLTPEAQAVVAAEISLRGQRQEAFAMSTHPRLGAEQPAPLRRMPTEIIDMIAHETFHSRSATPIAYGDRRQ